jgi:hypothetical protein
MLLISPFMCCSVFFFVQTAAELQKRGDNFVNELDIVISDVVRMLLLLLILQLLQNADKLYLYSHNPYPAF